MTLGLYQGDKLDAAAMLTHQRALNDAFLPQIAKRIEDQLRTAQKDNLEFTYEALKSYLMLYQPRALRCRRAQGLGHARLVAQPRPRHPRGAAQGSSRTSSMC